MAGTPLPGIPATLLDQLTAKRLTGKQHAAWQHYQDSMAAARKKPTEQNRKRVAEAAKPLLALLKKK